MKINALLFVGVAGATIGYVGGKQFTDWYFAEASTASSPSGEPLNHADAAPPLAVPELKPVPAGAPEAALPIAYTPELAVVVPNLYLVPELHPVPEVSPLQLVTSAEPLPPK